MDKEMRWRLWVFAQLGSVVFRIATILLLPPEVVRKRPGGRQSLLVAFLFQGVFPLLWLMQAIRKHNPGKRR